MKSMRIAAGLLCLLVIPASAAPVASGYGELDGPTVEVWRDARGSVMCSFTISNPVERRELATFLRIESHGRRWAVATDYRISDIPADARLVVDGAAFPVQFTQEGEVVRAYLEPAAVDALAKGRRVAVNFDRPGPVFLLRGAEGAIEGVQECARSHGLQTAGAPGTNDDSGYDIVGAPGAAEARYASVRGWNVVRGTVAGNFAYCAGERADRGGVWRLGWDGMQWQMAMPSRLGRVGEWEGSLEFDGGRQWSISGPAKDGWAVAWLGGGDLRNIRDGDRMIVEIEGASTAYALTGTAAVITKIEECVKRNWRAPNVASPMPQSGQGGMTSAVASDCPDDGPRLPFTGICAGQAVNVLPVGALYQDYLLPDPACDWIVDEVQVDEEALLYRALRCNGIASKLKPASWERLMLTRSALNAAYGEDPVLAEPQPLVYFHHIDPSDVIGSLDLRARYGIEQELRGRDCAVARADPATSPDGYIFDITPADPLYNQQSDGPIGPVCGPFSYGEGAMRFWRVLGDKAFLFDLSAESYQDIDPNSLTLLRRDSSGNWYIVE